MNFIGKILPVDGYHVLFSGSLTTDYTKSLTHLYQPLIGFEAVALYQTLLHDIELQTEETIHTHHSLMNYLNLPLNEIYEIRLKLEGIGLLKTYKNEREDKTFFAYELFSPFAPHEFFQDAMLTELLYHHLGESKFSILKKHYYKSEPSTTGTDITASFHDVFQTFQPTNTSVQHIEKVLEQPGVPVQMVDFTWIEHTLKKQMIPIHNVLTESNRKVISQLMQLYDLETYEIEKSILWALTEENELNIEEFKVACHDLFRVKHNQSSVQLNKKEKRVEQRQKPLTKEEKLVERLETISPKQLLEDLSGGNHASEQDMKLVRDVMIKQGLPAPVMNVLIHYVLLQTNMQLSKAYLEKIAGHWSRANLNSAREAMDFAKEQLKQFQQRKQPRKTASNEVIPDWFKERKEDKPQKVNTKKETTEEKAEILALLQKHASKKD